MKHITHLNKDKILAKVIIDQGLLEKNKVTEDLFVDVVRCIVGQQLSTKAADTIWKRFETLFSKGITPHELMSLSDEQIRTVGVSYSKIKYMKGFADLVIRKELVLDTIFDASNEEVIATLTKVKGIGPWTAEMILMFSLGREDVFSFGDLGLRNAIAKLYGVDRDDLTKIKKIAEKWKPYRTYAARYLWRSLDNEPVKDSKSI